tara:strand:+ start:2283 stop:2570 length:288 start_codon:yes stop_codon:yes gene_type:complete
MINILLVYNRKRKLTKKIKPAIVELPTDWSFGVELCKHLEHVKKTKKPLKAKVDPEWDKEWVQTCFPEWQNIWAKKNIKIRWHGGHRAFFLTYIK